MREKILVIKLGALGDLVLCMQAFASIRAHHPEAEIALLTMPAFAGFAGQMPWFDRIIQDPRPKAYDVAKVWKLWRDVQTFAPTRVYDFQGKFRQTLLFYGLGGPWKGPVWSGAAPGCALPRAWPPQPRMHYTDFLAAQLARAGVPLVDDVDLSWLDGPMIAAALPEHFALFVPGCSPGHPHKKWPPLHYAMLAKKLASKGIVSLAIGTRQDADSIGALCALAPEVMDLGGHTSLGQVAALARLAVLVVGNDTGPTHLAAAVGAPTLALMSDRVKPVWSAPRGPNAVWLQGKPLAALSVEDVWQAAAPFCAH